MIRDFTYNANPSRVVFGQGSLARLAAELERMGIARALILTTPRNTLEASALSGSANGRIAGVFTGATMHTPVNVTREALGVVANLGADATISLGGGSATGLGKAIALRTGLPQIVIPTTYAGSEMTPILGETENGIKTTRTSPKILPDLVLYDVDLTLDLSVALSGSSGMNAIAHAVEALYARDGNPMLDLMALEGIRALGKALPGIARMPWDVPARTGALYGAWLCGVCLGSAGMALHHKLCHTLGGMLGLPHAETHSAILPHVVAFNGKAVPDVMARIATSLSVRNAADGLYQLAGASGAARSLQALGMEHGAIDAVVTRALENPYWNPRPLTRDGLTEILENAFEGLPPSSS